MPHWISVQRSPQAFNTNDFKLLVLLVTLLGSIYVLRKMVGKHFNSKIMKKKKIKEYNNNEKFS